MMRRMIAAVALLCVALGAAACAGANDDSVACGNLVSASTHLTSILRDYRAQPTAALSQLRALDRELKQARANAAQGAPLEASLGTASNLDLTMQRALRAGRTPDPAPLVAVAKRIAKMCGTALNPPPG